MKSVYLLGGFDMRKGVLSPIDQRYMGEADERSVFVVDLHFESDTKRDRYHGIMNEYFKRLGATQVTFASSVGSSTELHAGMIDAGVVYLPGGDSPGLIRGIHRRKISYLFDQVSGIIAGNSAGAIALCKTAVLNTDPLEDEVYYLDGIGLVDFSVDPHYEASHDEKLIAASFGRIIYGIPEDSAILFYGEMEHIGDVWSFSNGLKQKVN